MASTHVRPARFGDVPQLVRLMRAFYAEAGFDLPAESAARTFEQLLSDARLGQIWLMECDAQPAGFVVLTVSFSMEYGGLRGFVDDFFVLKPYRQQGLGAKGLAAVRGACAERGVRALLVETGPNNETALRVYRKSGFADTGHTLLKLELVPQVHAG